MGRRIFEKIKDKKGFTLAEVLVALLIVLIATSIIARGLPVAVMAVQKTVDKSHAQVLLSTSITVLRDELSFTTDISKKDGKVTYRNGTTGVQRTLVLGDPDTGKTVDQVLMIAPSISSKLKLKVVIGDIDIEEDYIRIRNLRVKKTTGGDTLASIDNLIVRRFN